MQPQTPASPTPQYDFILKDGQGSKKGLKLGLPNLPKPVLILVVAVIGLLILAVVGSLLSGSGNSNTLNYASVLARAQEITRVSTNIESLSPDSLTENLATTVSSALGSEQTGLTTYLTAHSVKFSTATLAADMNSATNTQMQTASTNGNLDAVYGSYLKSELELYQTELASAYQTAGSGGRTILAEAATSTQTLLSNAQIAAN